MTGYRRPFIWMRGEPQRRRRPDLQRIAWSMSCSIDLLSRTRMVEYAGMPQYLVEQSTPSPSWCSYDPHLAHPDSVSAAARLLSSGGAGLAARDFLATLVLLIILVVVLWAQ